MLFNSLKAYKKEKTFRHEFEKFIFDLQRSSGKVVSRNLKHVIFGDKVDVFEFDTFYNFFEFIDGIAWELSFHGAPAKCEIRR